MKEQFHIHEQPEEIGHMLDASSKNQPGLRLFLKETLSWGAFLIPVMIYTHVFLRDHKNHSPD